MSLLLVFVSLHPAHASLAMGQGMMNSPMTINDTVDSSAMPVSEALHGTVLADTDTAAQGMNLPMTEGDVCQSDCDCCPGLCSAYIPSSFHSTAFLVANIALSAPALKGKVATNTRPFRPPISH
ncbi:hypothetical protein A9Q90_01425 [Gammaproteobacteria bacterium 54_18_T64]|nr:hypothetical protein A9Q90_01425 [Gammaproteobacteria bacterium 54_18_T64]